MGCKRTAATIAHVRWADKANSSRQTTVFDSTVLSLSLLATPTFYDVCNRSANMLHYGRGKRHDPSEHQTLRPGLCLA